MESKKAEPQKKAIDFDREIAKIYASVNATREKIKTANEHIENVGKGATMVGLSILGAALEIELILKQLFLCSQHGLPEYEILQGEFMRHIKNLVNTVDTEFGKIKSDKEKMQ